MPLGSFKIESVNQYTLVHWVDLFAFDAAVVTRNDILEHLGLVVNFVERPLVSLVATSNFLLHCG